MDATGTALGMVVGAAVSFPRRENFRSNAGDVSRGVAEAAKAGAIGGNGGTRRVASSLLISIPCEKYSGINSKRNKMAK